MIRILSVLRICMFITRLCVCHHRWQRVGLWYRLLIAREKAWPLLSRDRFISDSTRSYWERENLDLVLSFLINRTWATVERIAYQSTSASQRPVACPSYSKNEWVWSWWSRENNQIYSLLHMHLNLWMPIRQRKRRRRSLQIMQWSCGSHNRESQLRATPHLVEIDNNSSLSSGLKWWIVVGCT